MNLAKFTTARWIWLGSGLAVVVFLTWLAWPRPLSVMTAAIDRGEVRSEIVDEGRIKVRDVYSIAAPVGGLLKRIELEPGDDVAAGDVIATIIPADPTLLDARIAAETAAAVAAAKSAVAAAEADLVLARADQQRTAQLFERGFAAKAALDRANAGLKAAASAVSQRKAEVARARAAAGQSGARAKASTAVRSPASGKVLQLLQESEAVVAPGVLLMEIGDPGQVEIVAEFLSQDAALMREEAPAFIENWGGGEPLAARVRTIEPYARTKVSALGVEEQRVNVVVDFAAPEAAPRLGHGFRVDVRVVLSEQEDVLRVPTDALVRSGDGWSVFRLTDGRARLTDIAIGDGDDRYRAVLDGVAPGDQVVLFPGDDLKEGDRIRARSNK
jgi:HlyD family secretion protein